jgi:hypothetical protein
MILGSTLGELLVPLLSAAYFWWQRETTAVASSIFGFFENFLYIGTYMDDARTSALPLVGSEESDWTILFTPSLGAFGATPKRGADRRSPLCCQVSTLNLTVFW